MVYSPCAAVVDRHTLCARAPVTPQRCNRDRVYHPAAPQPARRHPLGLDPAGAPRGGAQPAFFSASYNYRDRPAGGPRDREEAIWCLAPVAAAFHTPQASERRFGWIPLMEATARALIRPSHVDMYSVPPARIRRAEGGHGARQDSPLALGV